MFVETLKCHGKEVRTGLDDKEIEWRAFTYIWIFECVNKKYKRYTKEIEKKYTNNTKTKKDDKEIEWGAFTYIWIFALSLFSLLTLNQIYSGGLHV